MDLVCNRERTASSGVEMSGGSGVMVWNDTFATNCKEVAALLRAAARAQASRNPEGDELRVRRQKHLCRATRPSSDQSSA
jgi:hypothetical protein